MSNQLYKIAKNFRRAIEHAGHDPNNNNNNINNCYFKRFPTGTCGDTCYMLAKYLSADTNLNISIYYVIGEFYKNRDLQHMHSLRF